MDRTAGDPITTPDIRTARAAQHHAERAADDRGISPTTHALLLLAAMAADAAWESGHCVADVHPPLQPDPSRTQATLAASAALTDAVGQARHRVPHAHHAPARAER